MTNQQLKTLRVRLHLEDVIPEEALEADDPPYYRPPEDSPEHRYLMERRNSLDGPLPSRSVAVRRALTLPPDSTFDELAAGSGSPGRVHHHGLHPAAAHPGPSRGLRPAPGPDHPRRGPHLRHGRPVPRVRHLCLAGSALRVGRRPAAALLHREPAGPAPGGGHHRGRFAWPASPRPAPPTPIGACPWCRSSSSTRCSGSSGWATSSGPRPTPRPRASCWGPPPGAPRCWARGCSTRTATAWCWPPPCPPARPTTRPSPTRWPPSSAPGWPACTPTTSRSSTTSPSTTRTT